MRQHKGIPPKTATPPAHDVGPWDDSLDPGEPAWLIETACCCPSRPAVRVLVPAAGDRPRATELLLCGHHFRRSADSLSRAGASVYDRNGSLVSSGTRLG
jgi:hypothetical protein